METKELENRIANMLQYLLDEERSNFDSIREEISENRNVSGTLRTANQIELIDCIEAIRDNQFAIMEGLYVLLHDSRWSDAPEAEKHLRARINKEKPLETGANNGSNSVATIRPDSDN